MDKNAFNRLFTGFILNIAVCLSCCWSQDIKANIDNIISRYAESGDIHGSVLVAEKGEVLYSAAFGVANLEWAIPNEINTKYRIYSMSKQFTALLIMQLVEEGKIDLRKPLSDYLPFYRKDVAEQVQIHHLLTHTHGIEEGYEKLPPFLMPEATQELILKYFNNDLNFQPGSSFRYSGLLGYVLLGAIIESVTGDPYEEVLQEKILNPAGMKNTFYLNYQKLIENRASDYAKTESGFQHRIQAYPVHANGASCLVSTVGDLLLWDQILYSNSLLSEPFQKQFFSLQVTQYTPYYYGYGWYIADLEIANEKRRIYYHTGGGSCIMIRLVSSNQVVIILNNVRSDKLYDIGLEILNQLNVTQRLD